MTIRPYKPEDAAALEQMALKAGYPYPDLDGPLIESCLVVLDDDERPIAAVAAQRLAELYLWKRDDLRPSMSKAIIEAMHREMAKELRAKGYSSADAFLPPEICGKFGRRLQRSFGWVKNWPSYCVRF